MSEDPPERYEAGTLPTPAIAGLLEGVRALKRIGIDAIHSHECKLTQTLCKRLLTMPRVTVYAPHHTGGVLLFSLADISSDRVGSFLNERGFCVRTGFHCAALAHATLGTPPSGAVRVSPSFFNTVAQIDALCDTLKELL